MSGDHRPSLLSVEEKFNAKLQDREQLLETLEDKVDEARTYLQSARARLSSLSLRLSQLEEQRTELQSDLHENQASQPLPPAWTALELGLLVSALSLTFALVSLAN